MIMNDIGMIAADTTRTIHYLDALIRNKLIPNYVLLLINTDIRLMPGQVKPDASGNLIKLLEDANIHYEVGQNSDINNEEIVKKIKKRIETVFIFSGFGGCLLHENILATDKQFLHVHGGYLPDYKGSTTNYYNLLDENRIGASSIFLTKDIDSGPILLRKKFDPPLQREKLDHTFDSLVRADVLVETLKAFIENGKFQSELQGNDDGETYYIIHPVLKHLAILGE